MHELQHAVRGDGNIRERSSSAHSPGEQHSLPPRSRVGSATVVRISVGHLGSNVENWLLIKVSPTETLLKIRSKAMKKEASRRLAEDHLALDQLLGLLKSALHAGDVEVSHTRLDLFWARLAVHIRAEHLQLFPAVIDRLTHTSSAKTLVPTLREARSTFENLQADHDFFMHKLAKAIGILRSISAGDRATVDKGMNTVRILMNEVEKRLMSHNHLEENQIYAWVADVFTEQEQAELTNRINIELDYRPPRFSLEAWMTRP